MKPALNNRMVRLFRGCRRSACQRVVEATDNGVDLSGSFCVVSVSVFPFSLVI